MGRRRLKILKYKRNKKMNRRKTEAISGDNMTETLI